MQEEVGKPNEPNIEFGKEDTGLETNTYIILLPDKEWIVVGGIYTFWIDAELDILYLKDGNGKIKAAFYEWLGFEILEARNQHSWFLGRVLRGLGFTEIAKQAIKG